jgi:hypothetical protein
MGKGGKGEPPSTYKLSLKWCAGGAAHPLAEELASGRRKEAGWRRDAGSSRKDGTDAKPKKAQLTQVELVRLSFEVALLSPPPTADCTRDFEHAWDVSPGYGALAATRFA